MELTNETFAPLRVLVDEFVRAGAQHAVIAPGSRNAPIAWVLGDRDDLTCWSVLDERQAGFFALGVAQSTGRPTIVTCTSGSAAANLHPAVLEAAHAGVPLIVLTADRPPELRDVGAGQAVDQIKLFGDAVRWFVEAGNHPVSDETLRHFRATACRAWAEATGTDPGPVHINLPLREPLSPERRELGEVTRSPGAVGRAGGSPWTSFERPAASAGDLAEAVSGAQRPLIVAGQQLQPGLADAVADFCAATGAPLLADSLSQMRRAGIAQRAALVTGYDLILRSELVTQRLQPDLIVRVGALPTSKPLRAWLSRVDSRQIVIDPRGGRQEATRNADEVWIADPLTTFTAAADAPHNVATGWTSTWLQLERAVQSAADHALGEEPFPFEPAVHRHVLGALDTGASVFISSSMPIRDVETYGPVARDDLRYLANRGSNGIDGIVSTALGVAAPFSCDRVVLLTGDLAFLYDASALAIANRHDIDITIVCVDNAGGGIFSFLPIAQHQEHFERFIATDSGVDTAAVVRAYGMDYSAPTNADELVEAVKRAGFVHLRTDRAANKDGHDRVAAHVLESVAAALADSGAFH